MSGILIILNARVYNSYVEQLTILNDINNGTFDFIDSYENMEVEFPNTGVTSMNMKSVKAKYLLKDKKYDEALDLLNSIKYDPLNMSEAQKAEIYFVKGKLDSMFNSSKTAWEALPLNQLHLVWYLKALSLFNKDSDIINIYNNYVNKTENLKWIYFYFTAAYGIKDDINIQLIKNQAKETLFKYNHIDNVELKIILYYIIYGEDNYKASKKFSTKAAEMFTNSDFEGALNNYQIAIEKFPINIDNYYNKMAASFKLNDHNEVLETFNLLPDSLNPRNGQFEFLMAKSYLNARDSTNACIFFNKSKNLNFKQSISYHKNLCFK